MSTTERRRTKLCVKTCLTQFHTCWQTHHEFWKRLCLNQSQRFTRQRCGGALVAALPHDLKYKFVDLFTVLNMWKYVEILNISASSTNNAGQTTLCNRRRRSWTPASVLCLAYHGAGDYMFLADLCDSRMRPMLFDLELCLRLCLSICANQNQPNGPPTACSAWAAESFGTVLAARCSALRMKLCREDYTITRLFSQLNGTIQRLGPALLREVSHFCQLF